MMCNFCKDAVLGASNSSKNVVLKPRKMSQQLSNAKEGDWPGKPEFFPDLMTPIEAAMFLRLNQTGHTPNSAIRTLKYWRDRGELKATKYARRVWYLKEELKNFLRNKTAQ